MQTMPDPDSVVVPRVLEHNARTDPDAPFASFEDGTAWTRAEAWAACEQAAGHLAELGVGRGDLVPIFAPNSADWLRAWWGATRLGAVIAPVNVSLKGRLLADVLDQSGARCLVVDPGLTDRLDEIGSSQLRVDIGSLGAPAKPAPPLTPPLEVWDLHSVMWTSGTTGPSKGALMPYLQLYMVPEFLRGPHGLRGDDVVLVDLPLFHVAAQSSVLAALSVGGRIAVRTAPAMTSYWRTAKETGATIAYMLSTMATFLMTQPEAPDDHDQSLRIVFTAPLPADPGAFVGRFGLEHLTTCYGATEVGCPIVIQPGDAVVPGSAGKPRAGIEARVVDNQDVPVAPGAVGELVVRSDRPWELSQGYIGRPEATAAAWRNGWFHTGDAFTADEDGYLYFHDRLKDALRRRGENISSFEVEREVLAHPAVLEAACIGVRSAFDVDDEVKVYLVPRPGTPVDLADLVRFLVERMPHFMVPRYFEVVDELPKTETMRVKKHLLREAGHTPATWDREAAGLKVTRDGLAV